MIELHQSFTLFLSLLVEALPFLLLGIVVSGGLLVFVDKDRLLARFPQHPLSGALFGSCLGMFLPVCQYGNIPVARRLLLQGASIPVAIGFLVAAPTVNPVAIWLTWAVFWGHPQIVVARVALALIVGTTVGCIFGAYPNQALPLTAEKAAWRKSLILRSGTFWLSRHSNKSQQLKSLSKAQKLALWLDNTRRELIQLGAVLVIGCAVAATTRVFLVQPEIFSLAQGNAAKILLLLLSGLILSSGSIATTFLVSSFIASFTDGSLLAFLLFGSVFDLKAVSLMFTVFRPKVVLYLLILTALLIFLLTLCWDFYI